MSWASTCPAAIAGLLAALGRSAALAGPPRVLVTDGMGITDPDATEVVSVGFSGDPGDEASASGQLAQEGAGGSPDRELYVIRCAIGVVSGDDGAAGMAAARSRAFALLAACGAAVLADATLGGAAMNAFISSWSLEGGQVSGGVRVSLAFDVSVDAYTQR